MKKMLSHAAQTSGGTITPSVLIKPTKSASLTIFHFAGDSPVYHLVQNAQVNLQYCIDGYDKSVMLKEDFNSVGQTKPTEVKKPNKVIFLNQLVELANDGYFIDVFIFAHGSRDRIYVNNGLYITTADLREAAKEAKGGILPIRLVYMMNCHGSTFNQTWIDIGAKCVNGARYVNFMSNQWTPFGREWSKGNVTHKEALERADTAAARTVMHTLIAADAAKDLFPKNWDKCPIGSTVLGDKPCAKSYFDANWGLDSEWQAGKSGKDNMNYSSEMLTAGTNITKNNKDILVWHS